MAKIDRQKIFGRGHCEDDSQKDRKWRYDLTINSTLYLILRISALQFWKKLLV
jgi:hypothetical protein